MNKSDHNSKSTDAFATVDFAFYSEFFNAAMASSTPKTIPRKAANNTLNSSGNKKVIVCAGIQNSGMVLLNTKFH